MSHFFKAVRTFAIALTALAGVGHAAAQTTGCTVPSPPGMMFAFNQVNVPDTAGPGTVIATTTQTYSVTCTGSTTPTPSSPGGYYFVYYSNTTNGTSTYDPVYVWNTNVAGVGIRITNITGGNGWGLKYCGANAASINENCRFAEPFITTQPFATFTYTFTLQYELIKTGNIAVGAAPSGPLLWLATRGYASNSSYSNPNGTGIASGAAVLPSTCTVATPKLSVKLSVLNVANLNPTGGETPFQIDLTGCKSATMKNVYINLSDATDPGNRTDKLTLAARPGSASGVSLQILREGVATPITFGPTLAASGNPGQWTAGPITPAATNISIPLSARYIATGTVKPGTVEAVATFTLFYK